MTTRNTYALSGANSPRDLPVALPIGAFLGDARIIRCRLDVPLCVNGPRRNRMLTWGGIPPIQRPDLPGEFGCLASVDRHRYPGPTIDLHLHPRDGGAPGRADNPILAVFSSDLGWHRFKQSPAHGGFRPHRFAATLLFTDSHVVSRHEAPHKPRISHLDPFEPLDVGDSIPAWRNQSQWKPMGLREWRPVHLITEQVVGVHGIGKRHAPGEVLRHLNITDLYLARIAPPKDHLDALLSYARFLENRGERCASPFRSADPAGEPREPVIAGTLKREDDLLSRSGLELTHRVSPGLPDEARDLQGPIIFVDDRFIVVAHAEEFVVGRQPRSKLFPRLQILDNTAARVRRRLIQPRYDLLPRPAREGLSDPGGTD